MFIMRRMDVHKVPPIVEDLAIKSYNNMHAGYRMQVGWGIGRLKKQKWQQLMKRYNCTKPKHNLLFCSCALVINFLRKRPIDFMELINDHVEADALGGWEGNH